MPILHNIKGFQAPKFHTNTFKIIEQARLELARGNVSIDLDQPITYQGKRLLHCAIELQDWNLGCHLVKAGANPNFTDDDINTPLHLLFWRRNHAELEKKTLLKALLRNMSKRVLNRPNREGSTPLHELIFSLLNTSIGGFTIHADYSEANIADWTKDFHLLKEAGVSFEYHSAEDGGQGYLHALLGALPYKELIEPSQLQRAIHVVQALLKQGASTSENNQGLTPLDIAEAMDYEALIKILGGQRLETEVQRQTRRYASIQKITNPSRNFSPKLYGLFLAHGENMFQDAWEQIIHGQDTANHPDWDDTLEVYRQTTCLQFQIYQTPDCALHYLESLLPLMEPDALNGRLSRQTTVYKGSNQKFLYSAKDSMGNNTVHAALFKLFSLIQGNMEVIKNYNFINLQKYFSHLPNSYKALHLQPNKLGLTPKNVWEQCIKPALSKDSIWDHYKFIIDRALDSEDPDTNPLLTNLHTETVPTQSNQQEAQQNASVSIFNVLPTEIVFRILSYAEIRDIATLRASNRKPHDILKSNNVINNFKHHFHPVYQMLLPLFGSHNWTECIKFLRQKPYVLKTEYWPLWFQKAYQELEHCLDLSDIFPAEHSISSQTQLFSCAFWPHRNSYKSENVHYLEFFHCNWSWVSKKSSFLSKEFMLQLLLAHPYYYFQNRLESSFECFSDNRFSLQETKYAFYLEKTFLGASDTMQLFLLSHERFRDTSFDSLIGCIQSNFSLVQKLIQSASEEMMFVILHRTKMKTFLCDDTENSSSDNETSDLPRLNFLKLCFEHSLDQFVASFDTDIQCDIPLGFVAIHLLKDTEYQQQIALFIPEIKAAYEDKVVKHLHRSDLALEHKDALIKINKAWNAVITQLEEKEYDRFQKTLRIS